MIRRILLLTACVTVSACSDPTGPCDRPYACEVAGFDLAVIDSRLVEGSQIGIDPETGSPVYAAGPVTIEFTVVNRGDSISTERTVQLRANQARIAPPAWLDTVIPALDPGESTTLRMSRDYSDDHGIIDAWSVSTDPRMADLTFMSISIVSAGDAEGPDEEADTTNNSLDHPFHVAIPIFAGTMSDVEEMRQNQPLPVAIRFENRSIRNANAEGYDAFLCVFDTHIGCTPQWWTYFERFSIPSLEAGAVFDTSFAATLPARAMAYPEASFTGTLLLCVRRSDQDTEFGGPTECVAAESDVVFRPDYESCDPPAVVLGEPLALAAPNCGLDTTDVFWQYYVAAFDAIAGQQYAIEGAYYLHNADGDRVDVEPSGFTVPETGRWYLIREVSDPDTLIVRMLE